MAVSPAWRLVLVRRSTPGARGQGEGPRPPTSRRTPLAGDEARLGARPPSPPASRTSLHSNAAAPPRGSQTQAPSTAGARPWQSGPGAPSLGAARTPAGAGRGTGWAGYGSSAPPSCPPGRLWPSWGARAGSPRRPSRTHLSQVSAESTSSSSAAMTDAAAGDTGPASKPANRPTAPPQPPPPLRLPPPAHALPAQSHDRAVRMRACACRVIAPPTHACVIQPESLGVGRWAGQPTWRGC